MGAPVTPDALVEIRRGAARLDSPPSENTCSPISHREEDRTRAADAAEKNLSIRVKIGSTPSFILSETIIIHLTC